jgi:disulfide oxidoreductase YuzD
MYSPRVYVGVVILGAEHICTECIDACWSLAIESSTNNVEGSI